MSGYVDYVDGDFAEGPDRRPNWRASIANVTTYPGILRAFDPSRAILCERFSAMFQDVAPLTCDHAKFSCAPRTSTRSAASF